MTKLLSRSFLAQLAHGADFNVSFWVFASNPVISIIEEGHSGVALFIVLSGFILSQNQPSRQDIG
jgi:peptidoglycan/LPS O-acetylase OafA/YrhL